MIRLGVCTEAENAALLKQIGFDYIELNLSHLAALPDEQFAAVKQEIEKAGLPVIAANVMLPGSEFQLCAPSPDMQALSAYLERAYSRAETLGITISGFGSGGARRYSMATEYAVAMDRLIRFLQLASPIAERHGVRIAIEPLREQESNIINTVMEARQLEKMANLGNVSVMADLYHMGFSREGFFGLRNGPILHCHIAEPSKRVFPARGDGCRALYEELFDALRTIGYDGGVSVEAGSHAFERDAAEAFALLDALRRR